MTGPSPAETYVFKTDLGWMGLSWTARGIRRVRLPERSRRAVERALRRECPDAVPVRTPPPEIRSVVRRMIAHLKGKMDDFSDVKLDLSGAGAFHRKVYRALRRVRPGRVTTYGDLAKAAGSPGASRAVGGAMGANPVPLLVPCHRVLRSGGGLGGFSAAGGVKLKKKMLEREGAPVLRPTSISRRL